MTAYPLRYTEAGLIFIGPEDDCDTVVDIILKTHYQEEFCVALDWNPGFIARLMRSGFLVMAEKICGGDDDASGLVSLVLPKLHLTRSVLLFPDLHVKKSVRRVLDRYELRFDTDFERIVNKCVQTHGACWLTPALLEALRAIRAGNGSSVRPVSFGAYRDGELTAGEFGILTGGVYTSYSGYHEESNSGTAQMILMARYLEQAGCSFLDLGMPLPYKAELGAREVTPETFVRLFREARKKNAPRGASGKRVFSSRQST